MWTCYILPVLQPIPLYFLHRLGKWAWTPIQIAPIMPSMDKCNIWCMPIGVANLHPPPDSDPITSTAHHLEPQLHSLLLDIHPGRNQNGGLRKSQSTSILFRWPTFRTLASHYPRTEQPACMFTRCGEYLAENFTRPCKRYCMGWYHAKSQPLL